MLKHAAITSLAGCNRRYFQWLFRVLGHTVADMRRLEPFTVGQGSTKVYEEHEKCAGEGCRSCGWWGQICRLVSDSTQTALGKEPF